MPSPSPGAAPAAGTPPRWSAFLTERGARLDGARVASFGDPEAELVAARDEAVLCDLGPTAALAVTGADAATFLQGQFTNDVALLEDGASQASAWCSPKGRVLANFLLRRIAAERFEIVLPGSLADPVATRLRMYVLRSKVAVADASESSVRLGLGGPAAAACIAATLGIATVLGHSMAIDGGTLTALPGNRFLVVATPDTAPALWEMLSSRARSAGFACWEWLTVRAAVPVVTLPTQDAFIPQALNLDALDALAFTKGCYTGQEIVARARYLGRLKERLALAHVEAPQPEPGTRLYASAFGAQACGTVVNAAPAPGGGADFVAVLKTAATTEDAVRVGAVDGPAGSLLSLPYTLPASNDRPGRIA